MHFVQKNRFFEISFHCSWLMRNLSFFQLLFSVIFLNCYLQCIYYLYSVTYATLHDSEIYSFDTQTAFDVNLTRGINDHIYHYTRQKYKRMMISVAAKEKHDVRVLRMEPRRLLLGGLRLKIVGRGILENVNGAAGQHTRSRAADYEIHKGPRAGTKALVRAKTP